METARKGIELCWFLSPDSLKVGDSTKMLRLHFRQSLLIEPIQFLLVSDTATQEKRLEELEKRLEVVVHAGMSCRSIRKIQTIRLSLDLFKSSLLHEAVLDGGDTIL